MSQKWIVVNRGKACFLGGLSLGMLLYPFDMKYHRLSVKYKEGDSPSEELRFEATSKIDMEDFIERFKSAEMSDIFSDHNVKFTSIHVADQWNPFWRREFRFRKEEQK